MSRGQLKVPDRANGYSRAEVMSGKRKCAKLSRKRERKRKMELESKPPTVKRKPRHKKSAHVEATMGSF